MATKKMCSHQQELDTLIISKSRELQLVKASILPLMNKENSTTGVVASMVSQVMAASRTAMFLKPLINLNTSGMRRDWPLKRLDHALISQLPWCLMEFFTDGAPTTPVKSVLKMKSESRFMRPLIILMRWSDKATRNTVLRTLTSAKIWQFSNCKTMISGGVVKIMLTSPRK